LNLYIPERCWQDEEQRVARVSALANTSSVSWVDSLRKIPGGFSPSLWLSQGQVQSHTDVCERWSYWNFFVLTLLVEGGFYPIILATFISFVGCISSVQVIQWINVKMFLICRKLLMRCFSFVRNLLFLQHRCCIRSIPNFRFTLF
jgi:hypothetical protein